MNNMLVSRVINYSKCPNCQKQGGTHTYVAPSRQKPIDCVHTAIIMCGFSKAIHLSFFFSK